MSPQASMPTQDLLKQLSRRGWFNRSATGFAGLALGALLAEDQARSLGARSGSPGPADPSPRPGRDPALHARRPQPRGPARSQAELNRRDGQPMPKSFTDLVKLTPTATCWARRSGSDPPGHAGWSSRRLLPHTAQCADDIAVVRSMFTEHRNHEQALWMMHTGLIVAGRPTLGAWVSYALGTENQNLPAYVVLPNDSGLPVDGIRNWSSGWLPPLYQGRHSGPKGMPVLNLEPTTTARRARRSGCAGTCWRSSTPATRPATRAMPATRRPDRQLRAGRPDAALRRPTPSTWPGRRPRRSSSTASTSPGPTATAAAA